MVGLTAVDDDNGGLGGAADALLITVAVTLLGILAIPTTFAEGFARMIERAPVIGLIISVGNLTV